MLAVLVHGADAKPKAAPDGDLREAFAASAKYRQQLEHAATTDSAQDPFAMFTTVVPGAKGGLTLALTPTATALAPPSPAFANPAAAVSPSVAPAPTAPAVAPTKR